MRGALGRASLWHLSWDSTSRTSTWGGFPGKGQIKVPVQERGNERGWEDGAESRGMGVGGGRRKPGDRGEGNGKTGVWRRGLLEERWILTSLPFPPCIPSQERPLGQDEIEGNICSPNALNAPAGTCSHLCGSVSPPPMQTSHPFPPLTAHLRPSQGS